MILFYLRIFIQDFIFIEIYYYQGFLYICRVLNREILYS
jgi:hypothetical protein